LTPAEIAFCAAAISSSITFFESVERLRARERTAVDEEGRRAARAELGALVGVGLNGGVVLVIVERVLDVAIREADVLGVLLQRRAIERLLILEERVVHRPELAVRRGGGGNLSRGLGVVVEGQGLVVPDHAHVLAVRLHDLIDGRLDARAERALEIRPLHDGDLGVIAALGGGVVERDLVALDVGVRHCRRRNLGQWSVVAALVVAANKVSGGQRYQYCDDCCSLTHG
jgi:hypothetical protein